MNCIKPFLRVVPGSEADTCCDNGNKVNVINQCIVPQSAQCIQRGRYSRPRSQARLRSQVKTRVRDREPSRISLRKVIDSLNRRKFRRKHKNLLRKSVPVSSVLHSIATNYKHWKIRFTQKQDSFYSNYFMKISTTVYDLAEKNILLSGDIELNPGPVTNNSTSLGIIANEQSNFLLNYRLLQHGLRTIDVGGGGDCFFKSVSHQLYGDSNHHLEIRAAGIQYLRHNPERFIESNVDISWMGYLFNMSLQGTWADHIIIQAVADAMNLRIHIIESNDNFSDMTLVEPTNIIKQSYVYIFRTHR